MRNYKTWQQAFDEVNAAQLKHEIISEITKSMFGDHLENLSTLDQSEKDEVWNNYYNTISL